MQNSVFTDKITKGDSVKFYESNWFLIQTGNKLYVAGYSIDVTSKRKQSQEIKKLASRISYITLSTSDIIWEWEASKNHLHINQKLTNLCGYYNEVKYGGLKFWASTVIYHEDRDTILIAFNNSLKKHENIFEANYRIKTKAGDIKTIHDRVHIIYDHGKPVRFIGCITDLTEKVLLERVAERQKHEMQKAVIAATVHAQEEERDRLSKELHDNVNQLILSSKMYISIAKNQPGQADELLDKAVKYQMMALEESRKLSKQMSVSVVQHGGFINTVDTISNNLKANGINVCVMINNPLIKSLNSNELLMMARIIQEQTSNIIKYAEAKVVTMAVTFKANQVLLSIRDDGKGFDPEKVSEGIGFTNIQSRVSALGGKLSIKAAPGQGCQMTVVFNTNQTHLFAA
jgi:PAS domain S-box-containing protein